MYLQNRKQLTCHVILTRPVGIGQLGLISDPYMNFQKSPNGLRNFTYADRLVTFINSFQSGYPQKGNWQTVQNLAPDLVLPCLQIF